MEVSGARKDLYLRQLVRRERSFETIKARRKKVVKEEEKAFLPEDGELLEIVGGDVSLMKESHDDAMKIRTLLARRALKAKEKFRDKAVKENLAKPKKYSFWAKHIAPIWREDYIPSSDDDEDESAGDAQQAKKRAGQKAEDEQNSGSGSDESVVGK